MIDITEDQIHDTIYFTKYIARHQYPNFSNLFITNLNDRYIGLEECHNPTTYPYTFWACNLTPKFIFGL